MASSSWCKETDEKINYTKLCRLLVDGGTQAVRSVFDGIHPPSSLKAILNANKTALQTLKKPRGKVLNDDQWDKLYPASRSDPKSEDFDISLLFVLLRNVCGLTPPVYEITGSGKRKRCWDKLPHKTDNSKEANLVRIKYYRNNTVAHQPNSEINDADFEQHWQDISSALLALGLSQDDIDNLKSAPLGKKDYDQLLHDWYMSDKDITAQLEDVRTNTIRIKADTGDMKEKVDELHKMHTQTFEHNKSVNKLFMDEFTGNIKSLCKSYAPNTRLWVLDQVKSLVDTDQPDSCLKLITAGPGMGKSTIAAKICQTYKDLGRLAGCHFFQFSNSTRNNPRLMLQSIARQMCDTVPGYQEALESKLQTQLGKGIDKMNCEELFTVLLEGPCFKLKVSGSFVLVLDAIDECCSELKQELQDILKNKLSHLPSWLRLVIMTRPSPSFNALEGLKSIVINPKDSKNLCDIEIFFQTNLMGNIDYESRVMKQLVEVSGGLFLVAFFLIDRIQKERIFLPSVLKDIFPHGLSSIYEKYFDRLRTVLLPYITEEGGFFKMLEAIVASKNPIPVKIMYSILGLKNATEVPHKERKARRDALSLLHSLFPVENDHVSPFHKSVVDFLIIEESEQDFNTSVKKMGKESVEKLPDAAENLQGTSGISDAISHVEGKSVGTQNKERDQNISSNMLYAGGPPKDHDFGVHVDDGNKVLVDHCYGVLSDILEGKKDLNKPLDLTDSETYALRLAWLPATDELKDTSPTKEKNCQKLRNYFTLVACVSSNLFPSHMISDYAKTKMFSDPLCAIIRQSIQFITDGEHSKASCPFRDNPKFGSLFEMVLNASYDQEVRETEISPNPLILLKKYDFSYFLRETVAVDPQEDLKVLQIVACQDGFVLLLRSERNTEIHRYQLDGTCLKKTSFQGKRRIFLSPDYRFILVIKEMVKGEIKVLDGTTLDPVSTYQSPNVIRSCHVYGNQPWFIVIRCYNNKIYVMDGETGQMRCSPIAVDQYADVLAVSASGHVLLGTTWESTNPRIAEALFTDEDGNFLEEMHWAQTIKRHAPVFSRKRSKEYTSIKYCRLIIFDLVKSEEKFSIHPCKTNHCVCSRPYKEIPNELGAIFSDDGKFLAFIYKGSIFIIQTSGNSLYRQVYLGPGFSSFYDNSLILFSGPYVVMKNYGGICFINIETNVIEHRFFMHNVRNFHIVPRQKGLPFTLLTSDKPYHSPMSLMSFKKYEFHNLKL